MADEKDDSSVLDKGNSGETEVLDLVGQRERLINERKTRQEAELQNRFQKAMGWDKRKTKAKKKKNKKRRGKP